MRLFNCVIIFVAAGLLVVNFTVSQWTTTPGWNFTNITSSCGPTLLRATPGVTGVIFSPNYPNHYPNSEACIWSISSSDGYIIEMTVVDLRMETCFNCSCDFVAIYDGIQSNATLLQNLCHFSPRKIHSTGKIMRVEFVADPISTDFGFQLNFTAVPVNSLLSTFSPSPAPTSPTTLSPPLALYYEVSLGRLYTMQTPEYPNNYSNNAIYRWQLEVKDANYVIHVVFTSIDIERCSGSQCTCDYLEVFDGSSETSHRIARLCSSSPTLPDFYSSGPTLYIKFFSDNSRTGRGFTLTYSAVHRQSALLSTTTPITRWPTYTTASAACISGVSTLRATVNSKERIYSPGYPYNYPPRTTCQWRISADQGHRVYLVVREASIENCSGCTCDKVIIYDGSSSSARELYRICMTIEPNYHVYGTGQDMFITFTSDLSGSGRGFVLEYWAVSDLTESNCVFYLRASTSEAKTIYYPGYPGNYSNNAECSWQIRADGGYVVQLLVANVDIEECTTCSCDKLQILDASAYSYDRRIRQFCGSLRSEVVYTTQQYAFLTFTSDSSKTGKGFVITYRAVTYDPAFYQTTVWSTTSSEDETNSLVMIIVGCLAGLFILFIVVFLILFLVKRRRARQLNTYSNLPHTGASDTVTSTTVPPMHYYQPNSGVVVAGPGVVYPAQLATPAFINEAFTPDLIPTSNQSLPPQVTGCLAFLLVPGEFNSSPSVSPNK